MFPICRHPGQTYIPALDEWKERRPRNVVARLAVQYETADAVAVVILDRTVRDKEVLSRRDEVVAVPRAVCDAHVIANRRSVDRL